MAQDALKQNLEERLAVLRARLSSLKTDATRPHSGDSAEQAQERENDEVMDAIGNETSRSIHVILGALERIENGTYGACEICGGYIGVARLSAIPEATRCLDCAR